MWDLKLYLINDFFSFFLFVNSALFKLLNFYDPLTLNNSLLFNEIFFFEFSQNMTFFFSIKFLLVIAFLILIRGGTPRYRYDYLTKLGWLKFLSFIILIFLSSLCTFFVY